jgi:hypothetical protein
MTKIEEIEQKLNECQKALAELKESKKEGKWKPTYGDEYWLRDDWGNFRTCEYCAGDCMDWRLKNVPLFPTKEACERYWHFMDTVKEKSYEFSKLEWADGTIDKFFVFYNIDCDIWGIDYHNRRKDLGKIYFKTEEDCQYIIDNFKDELMEYWL